MIHPMLNQTHVVIKATKDADKRDKMREIAESFEVKKGDNFLAIDNKIIQELRKEGLMR